MTKERSGNQKIYIPSANKPKKSEEKGQRLNSPNDLIFARDGGLFFTDPTYGLQGTRKEERELSYQGVYYVGVVEEGGSGDDEDGEQEENPTKYEDTPTLLIRGLASFYAKKTMSGFTLNTPRSSPNVCSTRVCGILH